MGKPSLWAGPLLLLNSLLSCGRAEDAVLIIEPKWSPVYAGEYVTFICDMQEGKETDWYYMFKRNSQEFLQYNEHKQFTYQAYTGVYQCIGQHRHMRTLKRTKEVRLNVSEYIPKATLTAAVTTIAPAWNVTLKCHVDNSGSWKYDWFRHAQGQGQAIKQEDPDGNISVSGEGLYWCRGRRGQRGFSTYNSDPVTIRKVGAILTRQHGWPRIFSGETITLRCDVQDDGDTTWTYKWHLPRSGTDITTNEYVINSASESHNGIYSCMGRSDNSFSTEWSNFIRLDVSPMPSAILNLDKTVILVGGNVTLTCSVNPTSAGWTYYWYRGEKSTQLQTTEHAAVPLKGPIRVSQGGHYWCRGGRGNPVYYTDYSKAKIIEQIVSSRATASLRPNWPEIYKQETVTVRCDIEDGSDTVWEYEWRLNGLNIPTTTKEYQIKVASSQHRGQYSCKGKTKSAQWSGTQWSDFVTLTVSDNKPKPVLTVSPSWLSPGAPVTLRCEVKNPKAGWRFYWFKAVPKLSEYGYSYELLSGTEQDSYTVHGQKHTAGFMCRAGRGDPVFHTDDSEPQFVWSGDLTSPVSLTVTPNRVQHFISQTVSLNCEGDSAKWRVKRFTPSYLLSVCYFEKGPRCNFTTTSDAVYWCESTAGQFSNAINITAHSGIIMVSPVHPVTEGDTVTLGCEMRTPKLLSNVDFYQNDKIIQNGDKGTLTFQAVSKSDEGLYKCESSGKESAQSWMEVQLSRPQQSFLLPLIIGVATGALLLILLLLLCHYRKLKGPCLISPTKSQSTRHGSAKDRMVKKNENEHVSPLQDVPTDESSNSIHLNNIDKKRNHCEEMESSIYSNMNTGSPADENITYAQLNLPANSKAKKSADENVIYALINTSANRKTKENKGKPSPPPTEETLYSEVKPRKAPGPSRKLD